MSVKLNITLSWKNWWGLAPLALNDEPPLIEISSEKKMFIAMLITSFYTIHKYKNERIANQL